MGGAVIGRTRADSQHANRLGHARVAPSIRTRLFSFCVDSRHISCATRRSARARCEIAQLLAAHPAVARVHYPGLPTHPQHELAKAQMKQFGTIVSFDLKGGSGRGCAVCGRIEVVCANSEPRIDGVARGGTLDDGWPGFDADQLRVSAVTEGTVRLSIGLEDVDDLMEDVNQALAASSPST